MANLADWWSLLATVEKFYWALAVPFTLIFIFQMILSLTGGDADVDSDLDADTDADHGDGFHLFSLKNLVGFFTVFSWTGIAALQSNMALFLVIVISLISGLIMMVVMASMFYFMAKLTDSGTMDMWNAVGQTGEVYLFIPARRNKSGKIMVNVQGTLRELDAITDDVEDIPTGSMVQVLDIINNQLLLVTKNLF